MHNDASQRANSDSDSFQRGIAAVHDLDLDPIKIKLMDEEEGEGWVREQAEAVAVWYKRFLILNLKYPRSSVVPNTLIDTFWHAHILDTMKYAEDCQKVFGKFFHHFPYFGMRGAEDADNLKKAFTRTEDLFLREFGEPLSALLDAFDTISEPAVAKCKAGNCRSCKNTGGDSAEERPHIGDLAVAKCKAGNCRSCKNTAVGVLEERPRLSAVS